MKKLLPIALLLALAACGDATKIIPTQYSKLDGWDADAHAGAYKVFIESCIANQTRPKAWLSKQEGPVGVSDYWQRVCSKAEENPQPSNERARAFFEENFTPYKIETESKPKGVHTGYYEPILKGSLKKHAPYLTPVYGMPEEAYRRFTREEIEAGALKGHAPVLLYVEDPVMLFFLHIQGSGKIRLPNGELIGLQYAGQNGQQFVPIGRAMKEQGILTEVSMQGIRDWLHQHPSERDALMNTNPSFVYFKLSPGNEMAKGALGLPLTPLRSIAVDDDRAAYGVPTFLDTYITEFQSGRQLPLKRLMVSQDTGGALHGPHRADIFFGRGEVEEWQAGHQNAKGNVYWLLPVAEGMQLKDGEPLSDEELLQLQEKKILQQLPVEAAPVEATPSIETPSEMPSASPPETPAAPAIEKPMSEFPTVAPAAGEADAAPVSDPTDPNDPNFVAP